MTPDRTPDQTDHLVPLACGGVPSSDRHLWPHSTPVAVIDPARSVWRPLLDWVFAFGGAGLIGVLWIAGLVVFVYVNWPW